MLILFKSYWPDYRFIVYTNSNGQQKWSGNMYTISKLAKEFGLARSTLLYYDRKNILKPSSRNSNNYRCYTEADRDRLHQICVLRSIGIPLEKIKMLIGYKTSDFTDILKQRLFELDDDLKKLRNQQRIIAELLGNKKLLQQTRSIDKSGWIALLQAAGLDDAGMAKWHNAFEKNAPKAHQEFLEFLGIDLAEIKKIRRGSAK